jgi:hypothetical protein
MRVKLVQLKANIFFITVNFCRNISIENSVENCVRLEK